MYYNTFKDKKISALGFGTMRLRCDEKEGGLIYEEAEKLIDYAISKGINYFETALGYNDGTGEEVLGKILSKYPRDSYSLVTKMPSCFNERDKGKSISKIFEEQLKRCNQEYFDFYLLHSVSGKTTKWFEDPERDVIGYLKKQRELGRIKHLGFSSHATYKELKEFLKRHPDEFEFCQIQLNSLDWNFQEGNKKYKLLTEKGIPVWVMEPLRGGTLLREGVTPEEAFTFLQGLSNVTVILSGMRSIEDIDKNLEIFKERHKPSEELLTKLVEISKKAIDAKTCTSCRYCIPRCPKNLNIPFFMKASLEIFRGSVSDTIIEIKDLPEEYQPSACIKCGACKEVCSQGLNIPQIMKELDGRIRGSETRKKKEKKHD